MPNKSSISNLFHLQVTKLVVNMVSKLSFHTHTHKKFPLTPGAAADKSLQRKIAFGKLSWELILSSAESFRFWLICVLIQYTEAIYVNDTILSHI